MVPAYRESATALENLARLPAARGRTLVILVLNRPDSDPDHSANAALRAAVAGLPSSGRKPLRQLNAAVDLYLHDLDATTGPLPAAQGVGLARKVGFDIAFKWMAEGAIDSRWICSGDADARLPVDYFARLAGAAPEAVAAVYPFWHRRGTDPECNIATALYELRLHHYVLGLEYAGSPYACHSLGSCLAVTAAGYAQVRGFPRRSGGEDFYLLNKLAKIAPIARLPGECIQLDSRQSRRVPFGTGPAVTRIMDSPAPHHAPLFYHPTCFEALRCLLATAPELGTTEQQYTGDALAARLQARGLAPELGRACATTLQTMGVEAALAHCRRQGKTPGQFMRQFHQWFDGFRTLKFIHGLRAAGWPDQSLAALGELQPCFWPARCGVNIDALRRDTVSHWGWAAPAVGT